MTKKASMVILVSGGGTNLQAIIENVESGYIPAEISLVISSNEDAYAIQRAKKHNINNCVCSPKNFASSEQYSQALMEILDKSQPDLIVLAGFMSILSEKFVAKYSNKIMNTHPSLLPSFGGKKYYGQRVHQAALDYGVKVSGATIMFVTREVDRGPIILQKAVEIVPNETVVTLQKKVLKVEHKLYPKAIKLFFEGKLKVKGRIVELSDNKGEPND